MEGLLLPAQATSHVTLWVNGELTMRQHASRINRELEHTSWVKCELTMPSGNGTWADEEVQDEEGLAACTHTMRGPHRA